MHATRPCEPDPQPRVDAAIGFTMGQLGGFLRSLRGAGVDVASFGADAG